MGALAKKLTVVSQYCPSENQLCSLPSILCSVRCLICVFMALSTTLDVLHRTWINRNKMDKR